MALPNHLRRLLLQSLLNGKMAQDEMLSACAVPGKTNDMVLLLKTLVAAYVEQQLAQSSRGTNSNQRYVLYALQHWILPAKECQAPKDVGTHPYNPAAGLADLLVVADAECPQCMSLQLFH